MSGLGFLAGGVIAALLDPRASYLVAGAGVLLILAIAAARLRGLRLDVAGSAESPPPGPEPLAP